MKYLALAPLNSRFLSYNTMHWRSRCHPTLFMSLYGNQNSGNKQKKKKCSALTSASAMTNKLSFFSNPGVSTLLLTSMKLWEAHSIAGKHTEPSSIQFFTGWPECLYLTSVFLIRFRETHLKCWGLRFSYYDMRGWANISTTKDNSPRNEILGK